MVNGNIILSLSTTHHPLSTIKAIRIHNYGGPDVLQVDEIPEPFPADTEVKINIKASGLNHLDLWIRSGALGLPLPLPLIPGSDGAGIVTEVGSKVKRFKKGDRVFINAGSGCGSCAVCLKGDESLCVGYQILGEHTHGTHCEFVSFRESQVFPLSKQISFEEGAAFPLVFMTAYHMLIVKGGLQKGQAVLIMAGGSGIGTAGIQIAKARGAQVITTVGSEEHRKKVLELGANFVIDHYKEDIAKKVKEFTQGQGVPVILEHVGNKVWMACMKSLAKGGRLVTCGGTTGAEVSINLRHLFMKHQQILGSTMGDTQDMHSVGELINSKKCRPIIHATLPYTQIAKGHEMLEKGGLFGKIILNWE